MRSTKTPEAWLVCHSAQEWHSWLAEHHGEESEVWLQIKKAKSTVPGVTLGEAVTEALAFGWIDGRMYSLDADSYILRFTPRRPDSLWSRRNRETAEALIADGRMTEAGMAAVREAQANGNWQAAYTAKEKPAVPADLAAALQDDPVARSNFDHWSNSDQLQAIVWIEQSKRPDTRQRRLDKVVRAARENKQLGE